MPSPTTPKRLTIIDRVVAALAAITAGSSYWATPALVTKRMIDDDGVSEYPVYIVQDAPDSPEPEAGMGGYYTDTINISVTGLVAAPDAVSVDNIEKSIRDIRKALLTDAASSATGTLGQLNVEVYMGGIMTDSGIFAPDGYGKFTIEFRLQFSGNWSDL